VNLKTYLIGPNKTRYISLSEARKLIPTVQVKDVIVYNANDDEMIVCRDDRIAILKRTTTIKHEIERINV